jgi:hypothetical protein
MPTSSSRTLKTASAEALGTSQATATFVATAAAKLLPRLPEMDQRRSPDLSENRL